MCLGKYAEYEVQLPSGEVNNAHFAEPVIHTLTATMRLYLSDDRSHLLPTVSAYYNQSYVLTMRFEGRDTGWSFDETMRVTAVLPQRGYLGWHTFERSGLPFKGGEYIAITTVQADWEGVTFSDWRALHGVVWSLQLCGGVPSPSPPP